MMLSINFVQYHLFENKFISSRFNLSFKYHDIIFFTMKIQIIIFAIF